ncbi:hypothetical protein [Dysgonomonas massiliensis]|uniref:hypothetical protein n=1 Tax=Dysgonomonas massiliensis TaxID=2040292 RepID=UPI000C755DC9|nr:hypothetical protein [Dysgonomonas massiliensis]
MKFMYSAFTENTPEMREWLEKLGYEEGYHYDLFNKYIYTYKAINDKWYFCSCRINDFSVYNINCLGNSQLFQAVTAMRDDSDYMQWFVADEDTFTRDGDACIWRKGHFLFSVDNDYIGKNQEEEYQIKAHKAALPELQEHFKTNPNPTR